MSSVWDLESGELERTLEGHTGDINSVCVTPHGRQIVSGSYDKTVRWVAAVRKLLSWH